MQMDPIYLSANRISQKNSDSGQPANDGGEFSLLYLETEIRMEIASKASKLPEPNVQVDPRAITKMAKDKKFYHKVMEKINSFTENPDIISHYPHITYSLEVMEDGDWAETMVNEDLKKQSEEAASSGGEGGSSSILSMLEHMALLEVETQGRNSFGGVVYDYSNVVIDLKKKNLRWR